MSHILFVYGTPALRLLYVTHLRMLGFEVRVCEDYDDASDCLRTDDHFQAVFIHVLYPYDVDLDFMRETHERYPQLPLIAISHVHWNTMPDLTEIAARSTRVMFAPVLKNDFETVLRELNLLPNS